jgi:ATP-dependent DNA helicase RecG
MIAVTLSCYYKKGQQYAKKRVPRSLASSVAEILCGLANANGGSLTLGVEKDESVTGIPYEREELLLLKERPGDLVTPRLNLEVSSSEQEGEPILIYRIRPGRYVHQMLNGKCFLQVGDRTVLLTPDQVKVLNRVRISGLFERQYVSRASMDDLDRSLLEEICGRLHLECDPVTMLRNPYHMVSPSRETPQVTMAALLLFGKDVRRWHPRPGVDFVRFEGSEVGFGEDYNVIERVRIEVPLCRQVDETLKVIQKNLKGAQEREDLFYAEKYEYPLFAVQEAVVNAVIHRDYSMYGAPVEVWMFDDRLVVRSPGGLPSPLALEDIVKGTGVHFARNPLMAAVYRDLEYMTDTGTGIGKMIRTMEENGQRPPKFGVEGSTFTVTLLKSSIYDDATRSWLEEFGSFDLNWRQLRALAYARNHGGRFTSRDYQRLGRVDRDTAYREIREMMDRKIVRHQDHPHTRTYEVQEPAEG